MNKFNDHISPEESAEYFAYLASLEMAAEDEQRAIDEANAELDLIAQQEAEERREAELDAEFGVEEYEPTDEDWADYEDYLDEYDGQPSEYDEWQDYMGGDDWDHGQYDCEY